MDQPEIKIEDLLVRPWQADDAPAVFEACQDPEIQRWTPVPRPYEMRHAVGFIADVAPTHWANRTGAHFGVFDIASGELLGSMALVRLDLTDRTAELGYWTTAAARGRGVATGAGRALSAWALDRLEVERLVWRADVGNHASRLVARRIGFVMEGTERGGLTAGNGIPGRLDGWVGSIRPGDVTMITPAHLGPGSVAALRARTFGAPIPTLPIDGGSLRPHTDDDIDAVVRACRDPETTRWTTVPLDYQRSDAEHYVRDYAVAEWRQGEAAKFVIADETGAYAGGVDLRISTIDGEVGEIGIHVAPWARGKGLGRSAGRTVSNWGFDALGLERIIWRAHVGNEGSRRAAEAAGFVAEGIQRAGCPQRGERRDAWVGAKLASDPR
ncbi:MAG TPA: GNAT family N-acetyltransferase [Micromonosporaceae bacterium]|jgi:RimJ/RimL family protein N-acetyltransferase